jgi:predicted nucleic acid-binding protein
VAVVSDTSPLSYLILIGEGNLLGMLYDEVFIPSAVERELKDSDGPVPTREWIDRPPEWLRVEEVAEVEYSDLRPEVADKLRSLDQGEREAIQLTRELGAGLLVIDERDGRMVAKEMDLRITGTLGILDEAAHAGLVNAETVARRLRDTSFRASENLYRWLVERHS